MVASEGHSKDRILARALRSVVNVTETEVTSNRLSLMISGTVMLSFL